jgi:hypothetical protein
MLWQVVRDYAALGHEVVLVSNDPAAFAEGRKHGAPLATNLAEELTGGGSARLRAHLRDVIEQFGLAQGEALEGASAILERLGDGFSHALRDRLYEDLWHPAPASVALDIVDSNAVSHVSLLLAYEALGAAVSEARRTDRGQIEASIDLEVRQFVSFLLSPQSGGPGRLRRGHP